VLLETFDELIADCGGKVPADGVGRIRTRLAKTRTANGAAENDQVSDALRLLDDAEQAVSKLRWPNSARTLTRGIHQSQRRLHRKWKKAHESEEADALHSWRKCVKDQAAQLRLFRKNLPGGLRDRRNEEKQTAEVLGNEHDLWLLGERLGVMTLPQSLENTRDILREEIEKHREKLRREAFEMGEAFSSDKPSAFAKSIADAWSKASKRKARKKRGKSRKPDSVARVSAISPAP
jgi:CHAD domain-containing protein